MNFMSGGDFRDGVDANRHLLHSAYHESGHVLAARHFGFRVTWASIDQDYIKRKLGDEGEGVLGFSMVVASERMDNIVRNGKVSNAREEQMLFEYCVEVMSGPKAEGLINPDYWQTEPADQNQAEAFLRKFTGRAPQRYFNKKINQAAREAERFAQGHEDAIGKFAEILLAERTIIEADIDRFIALAKKPDSAL